MYMLYMIYCLVYTFVICIIFVVMCMSSCVLMYAKWYSYIFANTIYTLYIPTHIYVYSVVLKGGLPVKEDPEATAIANRAKRIGLAGTEK